MKLKIALFSLLFYFILEVVVFIVAGNNLGYLRVVCFTLLTFFAGLLILKGCKLREFLENLKNTGVAGNVSTAVMKKLFFFFAGILLILPGLISDFLAIILLLPGINLLLSKMIVPLVGKYSGNFMGFSKMAGANGGFNSKYSEYFSEFSKAAHGKATSDDVSIEDTADSDIIDVEVQDVYEDGKAK